MPLEPSIAKIAHQGICGVCPDCEQSHGDQVVDFPVGCQVRTVVEVSNLNDFKKPVPLGMTGYVTAHCHDGRALVKFEDNTVHTFHKIRKFVESFDEPDLKSYDVILVNTSGGKDSQAMFDLVMERARAAHVAHRVIAVHCDLGDVEWEGAREIAEEHAKHYRVEFRVVKREKGGLLQLIAERGKWPDSANRYCTSYLKRDQVARLITSIVSQLDFPRAVRILNCMGLRADESPARAKKPAFAPDKRNTNGRRIVDIWLPIHKWTIPDVWKRIKAAGTRSHWAYNLGMPRFSCCFCVFASEDALMIAGEHNPTLLDRYVALETKMDHTFRKGFKIASIKERLDRGERCINASNWKA